ncbi:conserved hypothetical protein, secreted [Candidatus Magnetomorum sp. HK-1]|nr:conserved hypothetical protein, secreted [Candidatus Magnetomorum sp. HK-1]
MSTLRKHMLTFIIGLFILSMFQTLYAKNLSIPFSINETAGITSTQIPITFAQPLIKGDVSNEHTLKVLASDSSPLTIQVDNKVSYPDGSLKHALISFVLPELAANQTQTFTLTTEIAQTITADSSMLTDILSNPFDLTISINETNELYQSSLKKSLQKLPLKEWINGPLCTEWQVTGELLNEHETIHPHLSPIFYLRAYKDSPIIRVSVIIENNYTYQPNPQNFVYDLNIMTSNNISLFTKTDLTHYHHARLRKVFYLDISTNSAMDVTESINACHIAHDIRYLMQTKAVPSYDPLLINNLSDTSIQSMVNLWDSKEKLMNKGLASDYMNSASKGPLPQWTAAYLLTMHPELKKMTIGHGELAGSWPIHFRNKQTQLPVSIVDYPLVSTIWTVQDTYNSKTKRYENPSTCNEGFDCSCNLKYTYDSLAYVPYLLTGDYYFLEELQFNGNYGLIVQNPGYREENKGLIIGIWGLTGQSWALRTLEYCAFITPDNHPLKDYFSDIIKNNIDYFNKSREEKKAYSFGWYSLTSNGHLYSEAVVESDEDDYFTWSIGNLMKLGFDDIQSFNEWKSQFVISRMINDTYCWTFSALPQIVVGQVKNDTNTYFSSMDESFQPSLALKYGDTIATNLQNMTCNSPEMMTLVNLSVDEMPHIFESQVLSDDYAARMQIAMATAVDVGITGSVSAWHIFHNRGIQPDFSGDARPNFAIVPFSMHYARPGVLTKKINTLPFLVEGETSYTIGISLQAMPTQNVGINFVPDSQVDISPTSLTFTPDNFNVYQLVHIIPIDDTTPEIFNQGQVTAAVTSDDQSYSRISMPPITYSLYDNDVSRTLAISMPNIEFEDLQRGDSDSKTISFTNNCDVPVSVNAIHITGNDFSIQHSCEKMLFPNESCNITVSYSATTIGNDQSLLTFISNASPSVYTIPIAGTTHARILRVGPTRDFQWVRQASLVAQDNDIIEVDAGLYLGDIASWEANNLIIRGVGGRAHLHASGRSAEGKAIWVIRGENTTVENIEFSNCAVEDRNGAGIRLEGNNLILRNCYFHHNENGILTAIGLDDCELLIEGCEFAYNGNGNGLTHNMYINAMKRFTLINSYSHHTVVGHNVKTRAYENHILYNRIMDEEIGRSSYLIDFSQGGKNIMIGNVLYQGRYAENQSMISHNAEYPYHSQQELYIVNNTFVNKRERNAIFVRVYNPTQKVVMGNNLFAGDADLFWPDDLDNIQSLHQQSNVLISDINDAGFVNPENFDFHLTNDSSPACNTGSTMSGFDIDLTPKYQYAHPLQLYTRTTDDTIDAGAFEYTTPLITILQSNNSTEIIGNIQTDSYTIVFHKIPSAPVAITLGSHHPELTISPNRIDFAAGETSITKVIQLSGVADIAENIAWVSHYITSKDDLFNHYYLPDVKVYIQRDQSRSGLYISETDIDFGTYKQSDPSVSQTLAIANHQDISQTLSDISIEGIPYHISHNCPSVLYTNDYCYLDVIYNPETIGPYTGTLMFSTPLTHQKVQLNGRSVPDAEVIHVGKHRKYKTPRDASVFAQEGDLIEIDAGIYINNVAKWTTNNITIRGVNGMAYIKIIDGAVSYDGKAVWVVAADNVHIENIEISGCKVPDNNGAAIRVEGYYLWLKHCYFHHNENGILTNSYMPGARIVFENCHFAFNGYGDGYTHNMYINFIEHFIMKNCTSHNAHIGHNVKSRAKNNTILYNRIMDEKTGDSSYLIDFPYGGNNVVIGNLFHQGKNAENETMLTHAPESALNNEKQRLVVAYNTFVNERDGETICLKLYDRADEIVFKNNLVVGVKNMILTSDYPVATTVSIANNITSYTSEFINPQIYDYRLKQSAEAIDQGTTGNFMPYFHYVNPLLTSNKRAVLNSPDVGAYEYQADILLMLAEQKFQITETDGPVCYDLSLTVAPLSPVTVNISSPLTGIQLQPSSIVFNASNYSIAQQVCIQLSDNNIFEDQRITTLKHSFESNDATYNQLQVADRTILIRDNDPKLIVSKKHLDFGAQLLNEQSISKGIVIENKGSGNLNIDSINYNSSRISLTHSCYTIAVDESCQLTISITPDQTGHIGETIDIQSNDHESNLTIDISATGIESDTLTPIVSIGLEDYHSEHQFNLPITFGQVFKKGDVSENQTLVAYLKDMQPMRIQVDRKATYSDGSLKHAIISCIFPEFYADEEKLMTLYTTRQKREQALPLTLDDLLETDFDALVTVVLDHKRYLLSARELLKNSSDISKWISGPVCTEWHVWSKFLDIDQQVHPHLAVHFYIRAYVADEQIENVRVTTIMENNWTFEYGPRKFTYDVSISVNGHTYEKTALTHFHHARWKKDMWYHQIKDIHVKPDIRYLIDTKAISHYDKNAINTIDESHLQEMAAEWDEIKTYDTDSQSYAIRTSDPMSPGFAHPHFFTRGGAGWRDLGLLPRWTLRYLFSLDPRAKEVMMGTGHLAGSFPLHYRDQTTNLPVSIEDHPFSSIQQGDKSFDYHENVSKKPAECIASADCETPYKVGLTGLPSLSYVPYLLSGDYYYLEELQFMASYCLFQRNHGYRIYEKGIIDSHSNGIFEHSYPLRTLGRTAFITPDDHPQKQYYMTKLQDNLDFYNEKYTFGKPYPHGESNSFGYIPSMYRDPSVSFGDDVFTTVISHLNNLGFNDAFPLHQWKAKYTIDRMMHPDYCWKFASIWSVKIGLFAHCPETYFQTYDDIYLATLHENFEPRLAEKLYQLSCDNHDMETVLNMEPDQIYGYVLPHGAVTCLQPALASAVDVGYTDAVAAWDRYITRGGQADYVAEAYHNNNIVPMTTQASEQTYTSIIVDNTDPGFSVTGYWSDSNMPNAYKNHSLYTIKKHYTGYNNSSASWETRLVPGEYDIYAWWTSNTTNRNEQVPYIIHGKEKTTVYVNQQQNAGQWNYLGRYIFDQKKAVVDVLAVDDDKSTCADAIWFSKPLIHIEPSQQSFTLFSGKEAVTYTIVLEKEVQSPVMITISSDNTVNVSPTSLTFTTQTPQTVSLTAGMINEYSLSANIHHTISTTDPTYANQHLNSITVFAYTATTTCRYEINITPVALNFSPQVPGTSGPYQKVQIENTGNCALNAKDITLTGNDFEMINHCPTVLASGESCDISIRSLPVDSYAILEYLRIEDNEFSYQMPITGYGDIPIERPLITVGSGKDYQTVADALSHADHGTIIEIDAGTYLEDVSTVAFDDLTIRGVGGKAHLNANETSAEGKAIFVVKGNNTTLENIEFSNCRVKDKNGAGIRHEGLKLTIKNCYFHDNDNGILTTASQPDGEIYILGCIFEHNGHGDGYSHNMYINHFKKFVISHSWTHLTTIGHNIKSRASENHILYNRIMDEDTGDASYQINLPNGGKNYIIGNIIQQGVNAENNCLISQGCEGASNLEQKFYIVHNTMVNDLNTDTSIFVHVTGATVVELINNLFVGKGTVLDGTGNLSGNLHLTDQSPLFQDQASYDYHLNDDSPAINAGDPSIFSNAELMPVSEYAHPIDLAKRIKNGAPDAGAYESASLNEPTFTGLPIVIRIQKPGLDWNGFVTVNFSATAENQYTDYGSQTFKVNNMSGYTSANLNDILSNFNTAYTDITWTSIGQNQLTVTIDSNNIANIQIPDSVWSGTETITLTTSDTNHLTGLDYDNISVTPVDDLLEESDLTLIIQILKLIEQ